MIPLCLTHLREEGLDLVLEGEVERLGGEVPDDVGGVPSPEGCEALLLVNAGEAAFAPPRVFLFVVGKALLLRAAWGMGGNP